MPAKPRRSLIAQAPLPPAPPRAPAGRPVPDLPGTELPRSADPASGSSGSPESVAPNSVAPKSVSRNSGPADLPKYLQLERKETLLWPRQVEALTLMRRVLNRRRPKGEGERLTENTLIRVAVDLLLSRQDAIAGATEDELRQSLGL